MLRLVTRYTHVPLAVVSVLLVLTVMAWLLARRVDGVWDPAIRLAVPHAVVPIADGPPAAPGALPASPAPKPSGRAGPASKATAPAPVSRYMLESGPFASSESADRLEERLNRLGHTTVRFRKQDVTRLYVVALPGFASTEDAARMARELGRGVVVAGEDGTDVVVDRFLSLGEAVAAARRLRAQGLEVRLREGVTSTMIYHIRYGQFESRVEADLLGRRLAEDGIRSWVVKVR
jgi:cell division protein FtsN